VGKGKRPKAQAKPQIVRAHSNVHQPLGYGVCAARPQGGPPVENLFRLRSRLVKDRPMRPASRPLIARVLSVPAPTLLLKNSWDAEDCPRGGMQLDLVEL
jgi:hypothetical protein